MIDVYIGRSSYLGCGLDHNVPVTKDTAHDRLFVGHIVDLVQGTFLCEVTEQANFRVIDEVGLLSHFAKESPLDKINNVSYKQSVMGRIFSYGDVVIQTAAQVGATTYINVNHPKRLQETIVIAQSEYKNWEYGNQAQQMATVMDTRGGATGAPHTTPQVAAELEKLFELKMKGALSAEEYIRPKNRLLNH